MNSFLTSVLYVPPTCFGLRMRPFSLWHSAILAALESPFAVGAVAGIADYTLAAVICSLQWPDGQARLVPVPDRRLLDMATPKTAEQFQADATLFTDYLTESTRAPQVWDFGQKGRQTGAPWQFFLAAYLLRHYPSLSERDVWNMQVGRAICYKLMAEEENGVEIVSENPDSPEARAMALAREIEQQTKEQHG